MLTSFRLDSCPGHARRTKHGSRVRIHALRVTEPSPPDGAAAPAATVMSLPANRAVNSWPRAIRRCVARYPTKNALKGWHREYELRSDLAKSYARPKPKYSQEEKDAAIRHYLNHGRCIAATMRALGYPGRASLTAWVHELNRATSMRVVGVARRTSRPPALRQAAVVALCTRQGSAEEIAQEIGVCRETLYNWKNELLGREAPASMKRPNDSPPDLAREELERQLDELRRDIRRLQL